MAGSRSYWAWVTVQGDLAAAGAGLGGFSRPRGTSAEVEAWVR